MILFDNKILTNNIAQLTHSEIVLYQYTVQGTAGAAVTHWWFTGAPNIDNLVMRFYIDGEASASVSVPINLAAGIGIRQSSLLFLLNFFSNLDIDLINFAGFDDDSAPWGTALIGKVFPNPHLAPPRFYF